MASITGGHHIALTVTDVEKSASWYSDLLGMREVMRAADDDVSAIVLIHPDSGWLIGLRQYLKHPHDGFDEFRTGLDHFAFAVSSRAELEAWELELKRRSITFTSVADTPIGSVIVFRDPDHIQLEFWLPLGTS